MESLRSFLTEYKLTDLSIPAIDALDIIDIVIVSFIIYNVAIWIKETRAWTLFKGVVVIMMFGVMAVVFNLTTILFILRGSINVAIIAVIVVFQPELRKALEQLGRGYLLSGFLQTDTEQNEKLSYKTIDEMLKAVEKMSKAKTGALIVIEQDVPLGDHERAGIPVDSIVTYQLLLNIFEHNTPLHDGAVIIRNNRVAAASCFLPLTERGDLSKELGTRHRAAIGVSEVSDAFVLVVSEETGHISYAHGGELKRNISIEDIRNIMVKTNRPSRKKLALWKGKQQNEKDK